MIAAEIEQVGCGYFDDVSIRRPSAKACLGRSNSRFQKRPVPDAIRPAEGSDGLGMDFPYDLDGQMKATVRRRAHASFFMVRAYCFIVDLTTFETSCAEGRGRSGVR